MYGGIHLSIFNFELISVDVLFLFKPGDIVIVKKKNAGDGWCEGELNGKRGLFPKAYVRLVSCHGNRWSGTTHIYICNWH